MMGREAAVLGLATFAAVLVGVRCGGPAKEGGQGADCFRAEECAAGLVCIDQKCTSDLTSVNIRPEAGMAVDAGAGTPD